MSVETIERTTSQPSTAQQQAGSKSAGGLLRAIEPVRAQLSGAYAAAQEKSSQAIKGAESYIQRSPFKAVAYVAGIAAAIGILGGALLGRRNGTRRPGE